jgi:uncharacterized phosphosugar-binding protein
MQLLERVSGAESAGAAVLGAGNAAYFATYAARQRSPARRGAGTALVLMNLALAGESALYLAAMPATAGPAHDIAGFVASTAALSATFFVFALTLAARRGRSRR